MIECHNGKDISKYSSYKHEDEVLVVSGTRFIAVDGSLSISDMRVVHLKEITAKEPPNVHLPRSVSAFNLVAANPKKSPMLTPKSALPKAKPGASLLSPPPKPSGMKNTEKNCEHTDGE